MVFSKKFDMRQQPEMPDGVNFRPTSPKPKDYSLANHPRSRSAPSVKRDRSLEAKHQRSQPCASGANALSASALHQAMRWGANALALVEGEAHQRFGGLTGLRFNIGRVEGGIKANVIAPDADVRFGFRPLPSQDTDALHARFRALAPDTAVYEDTFRGLSLPAGDIAQVEERRLAARDLADALELPIGNAVDFWTEASLFSQAGLTAVVYGPGDIAQAHAADEWVALDQLERYARSIAAILQ